MGKLYVTRDNKLKTDFLTIIPKNQGQVNDDDTTLEKYVSILCLGIFSLRLNLFRTLFLNNEKYC